MMDAVIKEDARKILVKHTDGTELNYYKAHVIKKHSNMIIDHIKGRIRIHDGDPEEHQEICSAFATSNKDSEFLLADSCNDDSAIKFYFKTLYGVSDVHFVCTGNHNGPDALLCNSDYSKILTKIEFKVRHAFVEVSKKGNYRNQKDEMSYNLSGTYKFHSTEKNGNKTAGQDIIKRNQDMTLVCAMFNPTAHERIVGDIFVVDKLKKLLTEIFESSNSLSPKIGLSVSTLYPGGKYSSYVCAASFSEELLNDYVINQYEKEIAERVDQTHERMADFTGQDPYDTNYWLG